MTTTVLETDVVIIGGGATGSGILRDCSLRGMRAILLERDDLSSGATGSNHGLLHSGARYAVKDAESANECIGENRILKQIASHCIEQSAGLFIRLPEDEAEYEQKLLDGCQAAGIETELLTPQQALAIEPNANPAMVSAVKVPDGTLDPFRLVSANVLHAKEHGGQVLTHTLVTGLISSGGRVRGVKALDRRSGQAMEIYAQQVVNAAGIWGQGIAEYADLKIRMYPAKGSLLIMEHRINNCVLNRCRAPADADILVPGDTISLIGTTSEHIGYDQIDNLRITDAEVDRLISEGGKLAPRMLHTRILRAYAGVRPLVAADDDDGSGRNISRGIVLLDHAERDGLDGFITISGGKLMTYRLMAERTTDLLAEKLCNRTPCVTHKVPLPGSDKARLAEVEKRARTAKSSWRQQITSWLSPTAAKAAEPQAVNKPIPAPVYQSAVHRHGERAIAFLKPEPQSQAVICECEMVTAGEIAYAIQHLNVDSLTGLRRRTRLGMGSCQGELCSYRAAGLLAEYDTSKGEQSAQHANQQLQAFLQERWKGIRPVLWGDALRESEFTYWLYEGLLGISGVAEPEPETATEKQQQAGGSDEI